MMINLMAITKIAGILSVFILMGSCNSDDSPGGKNANPEAIFFDYRIWAEESKKDVTCMLQFRFGGSNGHAFAMSDSCKVEIDGEIIEENSTKLSGSFYEIQKPLIDFIGGHTIVLNGFNKKQYREEFTFQPFTLQTQLPAIVKRSDLIFNLEGLAQLDYIRVVAVDTSFYSEDINEIDTVRNGQLIINIEQLEKLANGPIILQLYKEEERPLKNITRAGGMLSITYGLKREFKLRD